MSKWSDCAEYRINKFVTDKLREFDIIGEESDYTTDLVNQQNFVVPFLAPAQSTAEMSTVFNSVYNNQPFGIWASEVRGYSDQPYLDCGELTYLLYYDDVDKLKEIVTFLKDLLNREDWTAADINFHFINDSTYPFDFKSVKIMNIVGAEPADDEGGRYHYILVMRWECTYEGTGRTESISNYPFTNLGLI